MNIREQSEETERARLSPGAALSARSRGRARAEDEDDIRTAYQRDRDRVLHCNSFRRLMHKTQVFISPEGDHYRTRLTHTLEVAQIARTVARALRLNEDLTEAIALGHDLGHTPFGHAGERGLDDCCPGGYRHFEQSVRVAEHLEKNGEGLNLSWEVLDGFLCHSYGGGSGEADNSRDAATLEGRVVRYADKTAYMNHDIEDAVRAGIITPEDLPFQVKCTLGRTKSERISGLVRSLIENSGDEIRMGEAELSAFRELRAFLFVNVYRFPAVEEEEHKAARVVHALYEHFSAHEEKLPEEYRAIAREEGVARAVCDYISGMSDRFAIAQYENLYIPRSFRNYAAFSGAAREE